MLEVIHEDEHLLVVSKPSGELVHRGWGRDPVVLVDRVRRHTGLHTVHPLHRLDRGTSGLVLFALDVETARALRESFDRHQVRKRYVALVRGWSPERGFLDYAIPKKREKGSERVPAQTALRRIEKVRAEPRELSLVEAIPRTGRTHQIRRHLKHLSHPLIGDTSYGKGPLNRAIQARYGLARLGLHAASLLFVHPITQETLCCEAELTDDLRAPLEAMGFAHTTWSAIRASAAEDWDATFSVEELLV